MIYSENWLIDENQLKRFVSVGDDIFQIDSKNKGILKKYPEAIIVYQKVYKERPEKYDGILNDLIKEQVNFGKIRDETIKTNKLCQASTEKLNSFTGETKFIEDDEIKILTAFGFGIDEVNDKIKNFFDKNSELVIISNVIYNDNNFRIYTDILEELRNKFKK